MPTVQMLVQTRYRGTVVRPGDTLSVPQEIATRWMTRGLATRTDEVMKPGTVRRRRPKSLVADRTPLPDGFPQRDLLRAYGFTTVESVRALTKSELVALKGIGDARAVRILEAARA